jgi:hypothetical protein
MSQYSEAADPAFRDYVRRRDRGALDPPQTLHVVVDGFNVFNTNTPTVGDRRPTSIHRLRGSSVGKLVGSAGKEPVETSVPAEDVDHDDTANTPSGRRNV